MLPVCCRFVAEMLPIFVAKLLIDNNVADVADFPARNLRFSPSLGSFGGRARFKV